MTEGKTQSVKKVTDKSTKQDIWTAYNELLGKIQDRPIEPGRVKATGELFEKLEELKKEIVRAFELTADKATESLNDLASAREEVTREKKRMFTALEGQKLALEEEIKMVRHSWEREQSQIKEKEDEETRQKELARRKEEDEYSYSITRKRREEFDKLQGEIVQKKEEINDEKAQIVARKSEINEMEKKIGNFPAQIEKAVKEAQSTLSDELSKSYDSKIKEMELIFRGKENLLNSEVANLKSLSDSRALDLESLKKQLSEANDRLKEMAVSAIGGVRSDTRRQEAEKE
jgi:chromosome segregation ATPase